MNEHLTTVMVIDDETPALLLATRALERGGYDVAAFSDPHEAWDALCERPEIRLVVSDWSMPGLSGIELLQRIRAERPGPRCFVLLCTSNREPEMIREAFDAGADDYVSKPYDAAELIARVNGGANRLQLDTSDALIRALAGLAESRDNETGLHLDRVQSYCQVLGEQMVATGRRADELDARLVHLVVATSPLHDIGKVGIPDAVLRKPGKLTDDEFECMKRHPIVGSEALDRALEQCPHAVFLTVARDVARSHHERWDGRGYPDGLSGDAIPITARLVAVADVYDAVRSERIYKPSMTHAQAAQIIADGAGTQFDPEVVAAFLEVQDAFDEIATRCRDEAAPVSSPTRAAA